MITMRPDSKQCPDEIPSLGGGGGGGGGGNVSDLNFKQ